jgi:hypothetical protein
LQERHSEKARLIIAGAEKLERNVWKNMMEAMAISSFLKVTILEKVALSVIRLTTDAF